VVDLADSGIGRGMSRNSLLVFECSGSCIISGYGENTLSKYLPKRLVLSSSAVATDTSEPVSSGSSF